MESAQFVVRKVGAEARNESEVPLWQAMEKTFGKGRTADGKPGFLPVIRKTAKRSTSTCMGKATGKSRKRKII